MKLGLGTAQFGLDYGISNVQGKTPVSEVKNILDTAARRGIALIDTAALYGDSEEGLGISISPGHRFNIVTKTAKFGSANTISHAMESLERTFFRSLHNLRQQSVYGLLIHDADDLVREGRERLWEKMAEMKQRGLVRKIGVSVYTARQIDAIMDTFPVEIIQLPLNVLDQRLLRSGHISRLKSAGVEIHARSVFLQGLLLMDPESLPANFDHAKKHLKQYRKTLSHQGLTPVQAALGFVAGMSEIDAVICGVNDHWQLEELCAAVTTRLAVDLHECAFDDESVIDPSLWSRRPQDIQKTI